MNKFLKFLFIEFIYNGHLQSLGSVGIAYSASLIYLGRIPSLALGLSVYSSFQFIYTNDRYLDIDYDEVTNPTRVNHLKTYFSKIPVILFILAAVSIIAGYLTSGLVAVVINILIMVFGVLYTLYFKSLTKNIFLFKDFYVAAILSLMVIYPFIFYNSDLNRPLAVFVLTAFVLVDAAISQMSLDIKDSGIDNKTGFKTLPVIFGKDKAIQLLGILNIFTTLFFLLFLMWLGIGDLAYLLGFTSLIVNFFSLYLIYQDKDKGYALSAGKYFLWLVLVLIK